MRALGEQELRDELIRLTLTVARGLVWLGLAAAAGMAAISF